MKSSLQPAGGLGFKPVPEAELAVAVAGGECEALSWLHRALECATKAESALERPNVSTLTLAAQVMDRELIPALRNLESALAGGRESLDAGRRASLAEAAGTLQARLRGLGRLLDGAVRLHAGYAVELASRLGYGAEGAALPLSVVRVAGRRCNLQA